MPADSILNALWLLIDYERKRVGCWNWMPPGQGRGETVGENVAAWLEDLYEIKVRDRR